MVVQCSIVRVLCSIDHTGAVKGSHSYKLSELANLRSGDKGNTANIGVCVCLLYSSACIITTMVLAGVIARHPAIFPYLKSQLTAEVVQKYFYHLIDPSVRDTPCVTR